MRKTLPVNNAIVTQNTFYNCGPACCENILFAAGKPASESVLARELGTTTNGTDYIGYLDNVLSRRSGVDYLTQAIPGADAAQAQRDQFWKRLIPAIDAGFGIAMNWIAPPGNYPRGVNGSKSPSYGGGTIYHYVAAMGYDDSNQTVFIVDSGFQPKTYWVTLKQCCSLIAGKGYAYPNVAARDDLESKPVTDFVTTYIGPLISDVKDVREQLTGGRDAGEYDGFPQLGNKTFVDALADTRNELAGVLDGR